MLCFGLSASACAAENFSRCFWPVPEHIVSADHAPVSKNKKKQCKHVVSADNDAHVSEKTFNGDNERANSCI